MEHGKSSALPQGLLVGLVGLAGALGLGVVLPINLRNADSQTNQNLDIKSSAATTATQQRIEKLKASMLKTWQQEAKAKGLSYVVPPSLQGVVINQATLSPSQKIIALTFDDGPWKDTTVQVLDILKQNNIKGTFFVVGRNLKLYPQLAQRVVTEGHAIGNHTWNHFYHYMNPQAAAFEINSTNDLIYQVTGVKTTLFRPPGGMMHNGLVAYAKNQKYSVVMWSSDSIDYNRPAVPRLVGNVMKFARPGGIVLMHDGGGNRTNTVKALPQIINNFKKQGYRFVTIPELLEMQGKNQKVIATKKPK
ncbi:polysaccharide deacetylase family protein [Calothrix sp. 336/3]|uniref:polysaccharide deacetylase family protein n=1 Tax=Calothrix sp. 336/3 TaxID=1337936 RepID=UPI0004E339FB|nr:polysaccharide deacetylase family protein [Calothrix sp. 336/3]AKG23090.1 polysaccharide deacetylase [Calothrix sp. 336/3]